MADQRQAGRPTLSCEKRRHAPRLGSGRQRLGISLPRSRDLTGGAAGSVTQIATLTARPQRKGSWKFRRRIRTPADRRALWPSMCPERGRRILCRVDAESRMQCGLYIRRPAIIVGSVGPLLRRACACVRRTYSRCATTLRALEPHTLRPLKPAGARCPSRDFVGIAKWLDAVGSFIFIS